MTDWTTVSALTTGGGTLVLAVATFASVRSANRAARAAERSLLAALRPLLVPSRLHDPSEKVHFIDGTWVLVRGGGAVLQFTAEAVYLAVSLRNVGTGIAVLDGWQVYPERVRGAERPPPPADFRRLSRDLYVPAGDAGFWQGAFRDPSEPGFGAVAAAIAAGSPLTLDLLYGDYEGGQRMISRFLLAPREDEGWFASASRHWNIDRPQPR